MAKLYGNKSAANYQLALLAENDESADSKVTAELLQHALDDGLKSIELDTSYEKGHFRLYRRPCFLVSTVLSFVMWYCCFCLLMSELTKYLWNPDCKRMKVAALFNNKFIDTVKIYPSVLWTECQWVTRWESLWNITNSIQLPMIPKVLFGGLFWGLASWDP